MTTKTTAPLCSACAVTMLVEKYRDPYAPTIVYTSIVCPDCDATYSIAYRG